jgi:hypothetical protein
LRVRIGRRARTWIAWIVVAIIFVFIGLSLYRNWQRIPFESIRFNCLFLVLSFLSHLTGYLIAPFGWKVNLANFGQRISYRHSVEILSLSRLGRYIPGKIWFTLGRAYMGKKVGVREKLSIVAVLFETVILFLAACVFFLIFVFLLARIDLPFEPYWFGILIVVCLLTLIPRVFSRLVNFGLKLLKRDPVDFTPKLGNLLLLFGIYMIMWGFQGFGFFLLVRSFIPIGLHAAPGFVGIYSFSWMIGFLSLITPAGLGVRETTLSVAIRNFLPEAWAGFNIPASLLSRIWATIVELTLFLVFAKNLRKYSR